MLPDKAYRTTSLFLPKTKVARGPLIGSLTFYDETGKPRILCKEHKHHYEVPRATFTEDQLTDLEIDVIDHTPRTYPTIPLVPKPEFDFREDQIPAWDALKKTTGGILNLACGKGKTVLGWRLAAELRVPTLIVSPQSAHLENWEAELHRFFDFRGSLGWIRGSQMNYKSDIVLCTVQTLAKRAQDGSLPSDFADQFGLVIYDECHCMSANFFVNAADVCSGLRIGLSATPVRTDRNEGVFFAHLGKVFYSDTTQDLRPTIELVETGIFVREDDLNHMRDSIGQLNVPRIHRWLAENEERTQIICETIDKCLAEGRKVYALSHSVGHVEELHRRYPNSTLIHGKVASDERLDRLNGSDLVFATMGVGKEAYNRKDLDTLLLLTPFAAHSHAAIAFDQSVGRIQRHHPGKKDPRVYLFLDSDIDMCRGMIFSLVAHAKKKGFPIVGEKRHKKKSRWG
jgi:superfamily II DNA or RNA helicase